MNLANYWCPHCGEKGTLRFWSWYNKGKDTQKRRFKCSNCKRATTVPRDKKPESVGISSDASKFQSALPLAERFVITSAQNGTPVHRPFFRALLNYCKENNAELLVIPIRYRNPTSVWTPSQEGHEVWEKELHPYLYKTREPFNDNLILLGDVKTQPTAVVPLMGFESLTKAQSGILGHSKLQLRTIATPHHKLPKIMTTTGSITVPNYTDSKAGKKGQFHHTIGAAVVEIQDAETFHLRQVNALKNGSFMEIAGGKIKKYTEKGVEPVDRIAGLVMGDTHAMFMDPDVRRATFGEGGIVDSLNPRRLVWHDVLDFYSASHHHRNNPFTRLAKHQAGYNDVRREIELTCELISQETPDDCESIVVPSNHNEGLERWVREHDWKQDPTNMEFYLETALNMVKSTSMETSGASYEDPFVFWARGLVKAAKNVRYLKRDMSYQIRDIEVGFHGDQGPNGSRGSLNAFRRIGVRSVIGHSHSPGIEEGCFQVGTNSLMKLEYNTGPSSWLQSDCIIYENGKRCLLNIVNGSWRL